MSESADFVANLRLNIEDDGQLNRYVQAALSDIKALREAAAQGGNFDVGQGSTAGLVRDTGSKFAVENFAGLSAEQQVGAQKAIDDAVKRLTRSIEQSAGKWATLAPEAVDKQLTDSITGNLKIFRDDLLKLGLGTDAADLYTRELAANAQLAADAAKANATAEAAKARQNVEAASATETQNKTAQGLRDKINAALEAEAKAQIEAAALSRQQLTGSDPFAAANARLQRTQFAAATAGAGNTVNQPDLVGAKADLLTETAALKTEVTNELAARADAVEVLAGETAATAGLSAKKKEVLAADDDYIAAQAQAAVNARLAAARQKASLVGVTGVPNGDDITALSTAGRADLASSLEAQTELQLRRDKIVLLATQLGYQDAANGAMAADLAQQDDILELDAKIKLLQQERAARLREINAAQAESPAAGGTGGGGAGGVSGAAGGGGGLFGALRQSITGGGGDGGLGQYLGQALFTSARYATSGAVVFASIQGIRQLLTEADALNKVMNQLQRQFAEVGDNTFAQTRDAILGIARDTGTAGQVVAQTFQQFRGIFGDTTQALQATDDAMKVVKVTGLSLADVVNQLGAAAITFKTSIASIGDEALGLQERFGVSAKETIDFIGQIAPVAHQVGLSLHDIATIGAVAIQRSGQSGAALGQGLERLLPALNSVEDKVLQIFSLPKLSGQFNDVVAAFGSGQTGVVLKDLIGGFDKLSRSEQNWAINQIASRREAQDLIPILQGSTQAVNEFNRSTAGDQGKLQAYFHDLQTTVGQTLSRLKELFDQIGDALFRSGLASFFIDVAASAAIFLNVLGGVLKLVAQFNQVLGGVPGQFLAVLAVIKLAQAAYGGLTGLLKKSTEAQVADTAAKQIDTTATEENSAAEGLNAASKDRAAAANTTEAGAAVVAGGSEAVGGAGAGVGAAAGGVGLGAAFRRKLNPELPESVFKDGAPSAGLPLAQGVGLTETGELTSAGIGASIVGLLTPATLIFGALVAGATLLQKHSEAISKQNQANATELQRLSTLTAAQLNDLKAQVDAPKSGGDSILHRISVDTGFDANLRFFGIGKTKPDEKNLVDATAFSRSKAGEQANQALSQFTQGNIDSIFKSLGDAQQKQVSEILNGPQSVLYGQKPKPPDVKKLQDLYQKATTKGGQALKDFQAAFTLLTKGSPEAVKAINKALQDFKVNDTSGAATTLQTEQQLLQEHLVSNSQFAAFLQGNVALFGRAVKTGKADAAAIQNYGQYRQALQDFQGQLTQQLYAQKTALLSAVGSNNVEQQLQLQLSEFHNPGTTLDRQIALIPDIVKSAQAKWLDDLAGISDVNQRLTAAEKGFDITKTPGYAELNKVFVRGQLQSDSSYNTLVAGLKKAGVNVNDFEKSVASDIATKDESLVTATTAEVKKRIAQIDLIEKLHGHDPRLDRELAALQAALSGASGVGDVNGLNGSVPKFPGESSAIDQNLKDLQTNNNLFFSGSNNPLAGPSLALQNAKAAFDAAAQRLKAANAKGSGASKTDKANALTAYRQAQADYNNAERDFVNATVQETESREQALASLAEANANGDPVLVAAAQISGATAALNAAAQQYGPNSSQAIAAQAALTNANNSAAAATADITAAQLQQVQSLDQNDAVKSASDAVALAQQAVATAHGEAAKIRADTQLQQAQVNLKDAMIDIFKAQLEQVAAIAGIYGDTVKVAEINLQEAQLVLQQLKDKGAGTAEITRQQTQVLLDQAAVRSAKVSKQEDHINFLLQMQEITTSQAIAMLKNLLNSGLVTNQSDLEQIKLRIHDLQQQVSSDLQFNLPSDINLPTLYEARRLNQTPGINGGYQDNRQIKISLYANDAKETRRAADQIIRELNAPPTSGVTSKRY